MDLGGSELVADIADSTADTTGADVPAEVPDVTQDLPHPDAAPELMVEVKAEVIEVVEVPEPGPDVPDVAEAVPEVEPEVEVEVEAEIDESAPEPVEEVVELVPEPEPEIVDVMEEVAPDVPPELEIVPEVEDIQPEVVCAPVSDPDLPPPGPTLAQAAFEKIGKAQPDEQFKKKNGQTVPKTNQAYVWSLASDEQRVWVGTVPNTLCLAFGPLGGVQMTYESNNAVCESMNPDPIEGWPITFPDWRPPEIWTYDKATGQMTQRMEVQGTEQDKGISWTTLGWRASVVSGPYYLVAGPGTGVLWGMEDYGTSVAIFKDGVYMGAKKQTENNEARKFVEYGGDLYLGTERWDGKGSVLKWVGDETALPDSLLQFEEVGVFDGEAAWLEGYKGRIYVVTWAGGYIGGEEGFVVYRSPKITSCGGLSAADQDSWEKVWEYKEYDPNPSSNVLAGGGAMMTFRGALYFGSMHVPFQYECADPGNLMICALEKYLNTNPISIFKLVEDAAGAVTVECLYGENKGGKIKPKLGKAGFGNYYNNYTWSMAIHDGVLYLGTMDYSFFLSDALTAYGLPANFPGMVAYQKFGFDLMATGDGATWTTVTTDGLGNQTNWGARWMIDDGDHLYVGTANPFNLSPTGGWELWRAK